MKPTPLLLLLSSSMITAETEASAPTRLSSTSPRSGSTAIARTLGNVLFVGGTTDFFVGKGYGWIGIDGGCEG